MDSRIAALRNPHMYEKTIDTSAIVDFDSVKNSKKKRPLKSNSYSKILDKGTHRANICQMILGSLRKNSQELNKYRQSSDYNSSSIISLNK